MFCSLSFFLTFSFKWQCFLHTLAHSLIKIKLKSKHQSCKCSTTTDSIGNSSAIAYYDFDNPIYQAEEEAYEDCDLPDELARLLKQEEKKAIQPHQEAIEMVNVGTKEQVREVKIGAALKNSVKQRLIAMLKEYADIFAWSYEDMPGLDTNIVVHRCNTVN